MPRLRRPAVAAAVAIVLASALAAAPADAARRPGSGASSAGTPTPATVVPAAPRVPLSGPALGFDTCEAPPLSAMRAWKASPYRAVGIYIGGPLRHCGNGALQTPSWVNAVVEMGWHVIPIYVGPQAPCTNYRVTMTPGLAEQEGDLAGIFAAADAWWAGLPPGSPIYFDLERYPEERDPDCAKTVSEFLGGWVRALHRIGFVAGFYTHVSSGISAQVAALATPDAPKLDAIWIASWTGQPDVNGFAALPSGAWAGARLHQYRGDHDETWGGVTLNVDSNLVAGPAYP